MTVLTLFGQPASPAVIAADTAQYTMSVQFKVSSAGCTLTGMWFNSASGAGILPITIALFSVSGGGTGTLVHSETPSWSGAAGSGWVRSSFASPPSLTNGQNYKAAVLGGNNIADWYSATSHYWDTGSGSGGVTNGTLSAPNNAGGDGGQDTFTQSGTLTYPATSFNAANYWVDPEVTTSGGAAHNDTAALTLSDTRSNTQVHGHNPAAALAVTPGRANVVAYGKNPKLVLAPVLTATPSGGSQRKGGPDRHRWWKP